MRHDTAAWHQNLPGCVAHRHGRPSQLKLDAAPRLLGLGSRGLASTRGGHRRVKGQLAHLHTTSSRRTSCWRLITTSSGTITTSRRRRRRRVAHGRPCAGQLWRRGGGGRRPKQLVGPQGRGAGLRALLCRCCSVAACGSAGWPDRSEVAAAAGEVAAPGAGGGAGGGGAEGHQRQGLPGRGAEGEATADLACSRPHTTGQQGARKQARQWQQQQKPGLAVPAYRRQPAWTCRVLSWRAGGSSGLQQHHQPPAGHTWLRRAWVVGSSSGGGRCCWCCWCRPGGCGGQLAAPSGVCRAAAGW